MKCKEISCNDGPLRISDRILSLSLRASSIYSCFSTILKGLSLSVCLEVYPYLSSMGLIRSEKGVDFPPISHPQPVKSGCLRISSSEKSCNGSESASGILADFDILVAPEDILSQPKDLRQIDHMPARYSEKDEWGLGFAAGDSSSCEKIVAHIELVLGCYHHLSSARPFQLMLQHTCDNLDFSNIINERLPLQPSRVESVRVLRCA
ncbi:hypothetical protein EJ05DRAFT_268524 [Pseudovirgaria hyperparasitica]|uniref:Uncharacterized protein n=1 Tax=Pseudovirgaria hyperparasitica TaxID=470096 RepID=A0A6A6VQ06_9PEZI|nr:uncharacterized protein EJ05DRAFT_268524 [Pseudovirgaria hyperparasitica]KAF2752702.1 hypothetical protein EJ05DRAFT_268524 [Pseudovirgaria hyperparasitica]